MFADFAFKPANVVLILLDLPMQFFKLISVIFYVFCEGLVNNVILWNCGLGNMNMLNTDKDTKDNGLHRNVKMDEKNRNWTLYISYAKCFVCFISNEFVEPVSTKTKII